MRSLGKVLERIRPKKEAELRERKFISGVMEKLRKEIKSAKVELAGSFAKGTFLEGDRDIDIFVLFRHGIETEAMESIVRAAVENAFGARELQPKRETRNRKAAPVSKSAYYQAAYAQHPYVRVFMEGRKIDVVPAYEVSHGRHFELKCVVDRTKLHTEYVLSKMNEKQKDEVRLLKKFLKANGLYGAEIKVQGYSGYLCELLILKYKTFANAMKNISEWKARTFIDLEGKTKQDAVLDKFETSLVVIDPVDIRRNVSAVVSVENYSALIALARSFLKSKNKISFFERKKFSDAQLEKFAGETNVYCLEFAAPAIADDILWGQVRRFYSSFESLMKKEGFGIIGHKMERCNGNICILFELLNESLPDCKIVLGPPLEFGKDCGKFSRQYAKAQLFISESRLAAKMKREVRTMEEMLPKIRRIPLPSHLSSAKSAKLYKGAELIEKCRAALEQYAASQLIV